MFSLIFGLVWVVVIAGCLAIAQSAFSENGVQVHGDTRIKGTAGKVIGVVCLIAALVISGRLVMMVVRMM